MSVELRLVLAFGLAFGLTAVATPVAIRIAFASDFHDHPGGIKGHTVPTPYLGGAALLAGVLAAALPLGGGAGSLWAIVVGGVLLWLVGTIDDRAGLSPAVRVVAELGVGALLWAVGLGWSLPGGAPVDLLCTLLTVCGLCNAFNLIDNMDGAAATTGAVAAAGIGVLCGLEGAAPLGALALALSAACLAFLLQNLASPARIFLGDGGSLLIGVIVAGAVMSAPLDARLGSVALLAPVLLAGVPVLDTTLVIVSRTRRGISPLTGGRDHLTHRMLPQLGSPRRVALVLAAGQATASAVGVWAVEAGRGPLIAATIGYAAVAAVAIAWLERPRTWSPAPATVKAPGTETG